MKKKSILEYYQKLSHDHNRENDYLKGLVIPVHINIKRRRKEPQTENKKSKSQYFEYFVKTNNNKRKVCKNALLILYQIKRSRLEAIIQRNREISEDLRGKHGNNWNCLPQEVVDILDFILYS